MGRESEEWVNKLKEKQQATAMGQTNGGWCRNSRHTDFGVQGMVVSRRTRPFPAAAVHLLHRERQWEKGRCLKAMAFTP